jgi:hypothetical protein
MPSVSNSSNIRASNTVVSLSSDNGNRIIIQLDNSVIGSPGFSAGDAIHYSGICGCYKRSRADDPATAEVFGVVESLDISGIANVVLYGSIGLTGYIDMSDGGSGGHDVYFLSGLTAGKLQSLAPNTQDHIVKAVYQKAPHGNFTGAVMNYIGYKVPST